MCAIADLIDMTPEEKLAAVEQLAKMLRVVSLTTEWDEPCALP